MRTTGTHLVLVMLVILLATACKKEEKTTTLPCYWHIADKSHSGELATRVTANGLESKESEGERITVFFSVYPSTTKAYKVANYTKLGALAGDECVMQIDHSGDLLICTGYDNAKAGIEVAGNGKLTVTIPQSWARHYSAGVPQSDSSVIDGFITEK